MPSITFNDFSGGLDRRLPINVQEASRLWTLRNAYITNGKRIKKRPGLTLVAEGLTGSVGLESINGRLKVFYTDGYAYTPPPEVDAVALSNPMILPPARDVVDAALFRGFLYVVSEHIDSFGPNPVIAHQHHYIDGSPSTLITDTNCPRSGSITVAASRIFAIGGEVVPYSAAGDARDWTTSSDAGFLPTGLEQNTKADCTAVGTFEDALVVMFPEGLQIWDVAVDPSANQIRKRIPGVGCSEPYSLASWASDLAFLSPFGFRSMTVTEQTDRIDDTDIGVPIDSLVLPDIAATEALPVNVRVRTFAGWIPQLGQYWCVFDNGTSSKVWAYTYSRTSKIACWSEYTLPIRVTGIATLAGVVYLRTASSLYRVDPNAYTDDSELIPVEVRMAFQDAKTAGVEKQFYAADLVLQGGADLSFAYDPRDLSKETLVQAISGDTRPGDLVPVEVVASAIAPIFRHEADEAFELDQLTLYYHVLGAVGLSMPGRLVVRDLELRHALQVVQQMRAGDVACVRAACGSFDPEAFAVQCWQRYGPGWALVEESTGAALAIGGLQLVNDWTGLLWLVVAEGLPLESWRKLTRRAQTLLANACDPAHSQYRHRVEAHVLASWPAARRFASKALGLELEGTRRAAGSGGEDVEVWVRIGPVKG